MENGVSTSRYWKISNLNNKTKTEITTTKKGQAASRPASMSEGQDEFVGIAVASLSVIDSSQGTRASLGDGEVCFSADQYFPVLPELPENGVQRPCIGHVQVNRKKKRREKTS